MGDRDASGYDSAPFIAEFYDYVIPYSARPDIDFYVDVARENGGPVRELEAADPASPWNEAAAPCWSVQYVVSRSRIYRFELDGSYAAARSSRSVGASSVAGSPATRV